MQIDLVGMARNAKATRRPTFTAAAITPTVAQRQALQRIYMQPVREWGRLVLERIMPAYERALREMPRLGDSVAITDSPGAARDEIESVGGALNRLVLGLDADLEDWTVRVEEWHRGRFGQLFTPVGVRLETMLGRGDVARTLEATVGENTALIRSLNDQMRNGISGHVFRGLTERQTAADVARAIRKDTGVGARRAELIAADQLQKLTGRLDQERQEQVGVKKFEWTHSRKANPRPEHVARNGKVYAWNSEVARTDPPGRAIRCGCRARAVIELDDEAEASAVEQAPAPRQPRRVAPPPPAPVPPPPPPPSARGFRSPVDQAVNASSIVVRKRLEVQRALRGEFAEAATDARYEARREFGSRKEADFGNAQFGAAFDDETVSMVAAIKPELDDLAAQVGVPPLRGFKTITGSKHVADQGDGVMGINPSYFNGYASQVGGRAPDAAAAEIAAKRAALEAQMRPLVERIKAIRAAPGYTSYQIEEVDLFKELTRLRDQDSKLWKAQNAVKDMTKNPDATTWRPGDDVKKRPFSNKSYYAAGVDRARSTLFHEFGHHVHQYLNRQGPRRQFGTPPLERDLITYYRQAMHARRGRQSSTYSTSNQHEWFAENFSAYVMGRRELVDETALELIERIFRGEYR